MNEDEFSDFLDSEDDALFLEASYSLPECNTSASESVVAPETILPENEKSVSNNLESEDLFFNGSNSLPECNTPSKSVRSQDTSCPVGEKCATYHFDSQVINSYLKKTQNKSSNYVVEETETSICKNSPSVIEAIAKDISKLETCNKVHNFDDSPGQFNATSYINNRFTPGFTPKARKRKFPGPAGLLDLNDTSEATIYLDDGSKKILVMDTEHIRNSQFTSEHLSLSSWQKLQADVSSHLNLLETAKFYSIQRVLFESSKKKLPKHMVVPILCVLLKELKSKEIAEATIFMDDTGEITGKIDTKVVSKYKDFIVEGAAFILKNVTFLCNVLILKMDNLISVYLPNGSEIHIQSLESVLESIEPMKPMNCECLQLKNQNRNSHISKMPYNTAHHRTGYVSYIPKDSPKPNQRNMLHKSHPSIEPLSKGVIPPHASMNGLRNDAYLEDLLSEDDCLDELLGNLDEKSFMGEL